MNKSLLKKFATSMRLELMGSVKTKIEFLLSDNYKENLALYDTNKTSIEKIRERYEKEAEDFIEEVAYTWFNRLIALRFMDVNEITSSFVVSTTDEQPIPQIFIDAKSGNIDDDLPLDKTKFFDLIDKKISGIKDPDNEAYKLFFISSCNYYSRVMPFMFEAIADYTELLLPDDMLSPNSLRAKVVDSMVAEDCKDVEIIGWLYQFYINEKKDEVIQAKKKYKTSEIPFASQLFTPDWLVQYITDNTLGQLWLETHPNSSLKDHMQYYVSRDTESDENLSVEDIKVFDPCCGSGHILAYAFDLLAKIYEEEGYTKSEIPKLILEKNLYGCDIDKRAMILANFALTMKAVLYHKRFLRKPVKPNIIELEEYGDERFKGIKNFGSLVRVEEDESFDDGIFAQTTHEYNLQIQMLTDKFDCIITNPPYINGSYMNDQLKEFVAINYPNTKSDLFACFMERLPEITKDNGYMGFVTPFVWMFIKSYEWLRTYILDNTMITNLVQLEYNAFGPAVVPVCSFTMKNSITKEHGFYIRLSNFKGIDIQPIKTLEAINNEVDYTYKFQQENYKQIPGFPIAYWINEKSLDLFAEQNKFTNFANPRRCLATGNDDKFIRLWHEVESDKTKYISLDVDDATNSSYKWFPFQKGGSYRKWYGNNEYLLNWENDGEEIKKREFKPTLRNIDYFFQKGITWTYITTKPLNVRTSSPSFTYSGAGGGIFGIDEEKYLSLLSAMNSKVHPYLIDLMGGATMTYESGDIAKLPVIFPQDQTLKQLIDTKTQQNIDISTEDWDSREVSWEFIRNELLKHKSDDKIETAFENYCNYWREKFCMLHQSEEELNKLFIEIYGLEDELDELVDFNDITILKNETKVEEVLIPPHTKEEADEGDKTSEGYLYNRGAQLNFNADEIMKQFISYAVGVMFGRYSLDQDGLIVANLNQDYPKDTTFEIDDDNVIPVLDDEYFSDDIVARFINFIKITFGEESLSENIKFIEESLGKDLRKYFVKDFYPDHIKRYKKRPIYWMVSSPKKGFMSLIYMHRYTPDIFGRVRNSYLTEYIAKLEAHKETLTLTTQSSTASNKDKKDADKAIKIIDAKLKEIIAFDRDVMMSYAQDGIEIDLDDGVKVNYCKFQDILYEFDKKLCK